MWAQPLGGVCSLEPLLRMKLALIQTYDTCFVKSPEKYRKA